MSEKITACISTYNEEDNIAACIASVAGVDDVVVGDDGSTDRTVEIAKSCGARVFRRHDWAAKTTQEDVDKFTARFGWAPEFVAGRRIRNGLLEARETLGAASSDGVVVPDAAERVTWDLPATNSGAQPKRAVNLSTSSWVVLAAQSRRRKTRAPQDFAISTVRSVEPSSPTTMSSTPATEAMHAAMLLSSLNVEMQAVIFSLIVLGPGEI